MKRLGITLCFLALLLPTTVMSADQVVTQVWYINNGPGTLYQWGDSDPQLGAFWEWMNSMAIAPCDTLCAVADVLQPPQEYYATCTVQYSCTFWCHFWAELYLSNNYPDHNNPVYAALGVGTPGNAGSFVQVSTTVTVNVTNLTPTCGIPYIFDFGIVPSFTLSNQALMLKIWTTVPPGDVHIYWDSECCPSALYSDCTLPVEETTWGSIKNLYQR